MLCSLDRPRSANSGHLSQLYFHQAFHDYSVQGTVSMRYKPSAQYVKSFQRGPSRVVIVLVSVMLFLGYLMFFGPAKSKDDPTGPFLFTVLVVGGIGFMQVRRLRKAAAELATVSYVLLDEGISVESSSATYVISYQGIHTVTIKRRFFSEDIAQVLLKGTGGEAALPSLETPDPFVIALRQRMGSVPFVEKRSLLV
jgi:hypothetical protein